MPVIISKIERQKKNKGRYSLYSAEKYIMGVSEETLFEFNLVPGKSLTAEDIERISQKETYLAVRDQAWRFLSRRMHSEKELEIKLINKGYKNNNIEQIIQELREKQYLDDEMFARQVISDEIDFKKSGPMLIKNKLLKKGIEMPLVNSLLEESYPDELQLTNCEHHAKKKLKSYTNKIDSPIKNKLGAFLTQKGFTWDIINHVISELDQS